MPFHKPPFNNQAPDPRTLERAYLRCGRNLYQVLRSSVSATDPMLMEDCKTLAVSASSREWVLAECELVIPEAP